MTTVDVADAALAAADANWALNGLKASKHEAVTMDAFEFLERAHAGELWWTAVPCSADMACHLARDNHGVCLTSAYNQGC